MCTNPSTPYARAHTHHTCALFLLTIASKLLEYPQNWAQTRARARAHTPQPTCCTRYCCVRPHLRRPMAGRCVTGGGTYLNQKIYRHHEVGENVENSKPLWNPLLFCISETGVDDGKRGSESTSKRRAFEFWCFGRHCHFSLDQRRQISCWWCCCCVRGRGWWLHDGQKMRRLPSSRQNRVHAHTGRQHNTACHPIRLNIMEGTYLL